MLNMADHSESSPSSSQDPEHFSLPEQRQFEIVEGEPGRPTEGTGRVVRKIGGEFDALVQLAASWQASIDRMEELSNSSTHCETDPQDSLSPSAIFLAAAALAVERHTAEALQLLRQTGRSETAVDRLRLTSAEIAEVHKFIEDAREILPGLTPGSTLAKRVEEKLQTSLRYRMEELMEDIDPIHRQAIVEGVKVVLRQVSCFPPYEVPTDDDPETAT